MPSRTIAGAVSSHPSQRRHSARGTQISLREQPRCRPKFIPPSSSDSSPSSDERTLLTCYIDRLPGTLEYRYRSPVGGWRGPRRRGCQLSLLLFRLRARARAGAESRPILPALAGSASHGCTGLALRCTAPLHSGPAWRPRPAPASQFSSSGGLDDPRCDRYDGQRHAPR